MTLPPQPPTPQAATVPAGGQGTPSTRPAYLSEALRTLDPERLDAYCDPARPNPSLLDKLGCYTWNVALCESLYPVLHLAEVLLRNSVYRAVETAYHINPSRGALCWLDAGTVVLTAEHAQRVKEIKAKLSRRLTASGHRITAGRLIAELNFGFWRYLFDTDYGYQTAADPRLWPGLLNKAFPHLPASLSGRRDAIQTKLTRIRELRNRAFHHEPVWKYPDLQQRYDDAVDLLNWISPPVARTVVTLDRFWHVYQAAAHRHLRREVYTLSGKS